jgi:hypothetical protein
LKYGLILILFVAIPCWSQTTTTGKAETKGPCSPAVTGSNNQFTINCQGITKKQGEQFLKILNKIAQSQLDPNEVMKKLDDIQESVDQLRKHPPYHYGPLDEDTRKALIRGLSGHNATISIATRNPSPEIIDFATTLQKVFHDAHWNSSGPAMIIAPPDVGDNGVIPIPKGLNIYARSQRYELALFVQQQLKRVANIDAHVERDESETADLRLFVGSPE